MLVLVCTKLSSQDQNGPSISFLNYLAVLSGSYLPATDIVGNQASYLSNYLLLKPSPAPIFEDKGVLTVEQFQGGVSVERGLWVSEEILNQNRFVTHMLNITALTQADSNLRFRFDFQELKNLLTIDLDYTHACDGVVSQRPGEDAVFDVIVPDCYDGVAGPQSFSVVVSCSQILITLYDNNGDQSIPVVQMARSKTESFPLPEYMVSSKQNYKSPCI
ncbi:hypothetical protein Btru_057890 [Bulinus truncatus]|nr:hypothetical protein Btru_057890 [Bulinus truncatus]